MGEIIAIIFGVVFVLLVGMTIGAELQSEKICKARGGVPVKFQCFKADSELK